MASKAMKNKFGMLDRKRVVKDAIVVKEDPITTVVNTIESKFDYDSLNVSLEDKENLINYEREVLYQKGRMIESALITGEYLEKARELFNRYGEENNSYMAWYQALGFSKDQVYLLRGRYRLSLEHPTHKTVIADLSGKEVKELINKKVEKEQVEKVLSSGIRTAPEIKKAISTAAEIDKFENLKNDKDKLLSRLGELESRIPRLEEELRELKAEKEKVKEKIKYRLNNMTSVLYRIGDIYQLRFGDEYGGNHTLIPGNVVKIISERGVEKGTVILKDNGLLALRIKNDEIELHNLADNNLFHFKLVESR